MKLGEFTVFAALSAGMAWGLDHSQQPERTAEFTCAEVVRHIDPLKTCEHPLVPTPDGEGFEEYDPARIDEIRVACQDYLHQVYQVAQEGRSRPPAATIVRP